MTLGSSLWRVHNQSCRYWGDFFVLAENEVNARAHAGDILAGLDHNGKRHYGPAARFISSIEKVRPEELEHDDYKYHKFWDKPFYNPRTLQYYSTPELKREIERRERDDADRQAAAACGVAFDAFRRVKDYLQAHAEAKVSL